jgi:1-deoxy-D-xylulose-5-phosphate reductoisomerase
MKRIGIFGSTGSIGQSTLEVVRDQKEHFQVVVLVAGTNDQLLEAQARTWKPELVALADETRGRQLADRLQDENCRVVWGEEGLMMAAAWETMDQALFSIVGAQGLLPICEAISAGKDVAVANKEPLVMAWPVISELLKKHKTQLIPVDSEHSAVWQCLEGHNRSDLKKIHLTASGGPFFDCSKEEIEKATVKQALNHPKWSMGRKITIDSATLMNKGLELIEAVNLFGVKPKDVEILIHPESIVHSMVEFQDGSLLAQLSITDMKLPIQYALSYPKRLTNNYPTLDLTQLRQLNFHRPDAEKFPAIQLAYDAALAGGTMPAVLNAANEVAVNMFLEEKIKFLEIVELIERVMQQHKIIQNPELPEILEMDGWARQQTEEVASGKLSI